MDARREGAGFSTGANERSLVGGQETLVGKALDLVKPWSGPWRGRSRFDEVGWSGSAGVEDGQSRRESVEGSRMPSLWFLRKTRAFLKWDVSLPQ